MSADGAGYRTLREMDALRPKRRRISDQCAALLILLLLFAAMWTASAVGYVLTGVAG